MSDELNYSVDLINNQIADADDVDTKFSEARTYINRLFDLQEGECINNKITATVGSDDLTVRLKTREGSDPTSSSQVYCRIGDTILKVSSALSVTLDDADGDYFDWDTGKIQGNDAQLFVYIINNNGTAQLGVSPSCHLTTVETNYYDAGGQTGSAGFTNMVMSGTRNATNTCQVIGRINVKQADDNDWESPGTSLVINRPIYETESLKMTNSDGNTSRYYQVIQDTVVISGWGYVEGNNSSKQKFKTESFGITFSERPTNVVAGSSKANTSSIPTHAADGGSSNVSWRTIINGLTTTAVAMGVARASADGSDPGFLSSSVYYLYTFSLRGKL
jgi:hypothetical protein